MGNDCVKVYWEDAVIYGKINDSRSLGLSKKITEGELYKKDKDFIVIKDPETLTYDKQKNEYALLITDKRITFFYIPKGMVKKIEKISRFDPKN